MLTLGLMLLFLASGGLTGILPLILMIAGLVFFLIATFWGNPAPGWNRLVAAGLAAWIAAMLLQMVGGL